MLSRLQQSIALKALETARGEPSPAMPQLGWLRAIRDALRLTRAAVAQRQGVGGAAIQALERSEAEGRISVATLRRAADALGCEVVLKLVPKNDRTFIDLAAENDPELQRLRRVEHSMALEAQESGDLEQRKGDRFK
jgi:predicted DNA-binding mobile mystery protein A